MRKSGELDTLPVVDEDDLLTGEMHASWWRPITRLVLQKNPAAFFNIVFRVVRKSGHWDFGVTPSVTPAATGYSG